MQMSLKYELVPSFQIFGQLLWWPDSETLTVTSDWVLPIMASAFFTHLICLDTALQHSSN